MTSLLLRVCTPLLRAEAPCLQCEWQVSLLVLPSVEEDWLRGVTGHLLRAGVLEDGGDHVPEGVARRVPLGKVKVARAVGCAYARK